MPAALRFCMFACLRSCISAYAFLRFRKVHTFLHMNMQLKKNKATEKVWLRRYLMKVLLLLHHMNTLLLLQHGIMAHISRRAVRKVTEATVCKAYACTYIFVCVCLCTS